MIDACRRCAACAWQGASCKDVCNAFYGFLAEAGISSHRSTVVQAVAEKLNVFIPGLYDSSSFE
jgi:hypothetical protein